MRKTQWPDGSDVSGGVPRHLDPQYDVEEKIIGFLCECGCYNDDHSETECLGCDTGCTGYKPDEGQPLYEEPYELDPDDMPGGRDYDD